MATSKRKRKARQAGEAITAKIKETTKKRHETHGHSYTRTIKTTAPSFPKPKRKDSDTFEDEYKRFRKTRGRQGLNPKPEQRGPESPTYLNRHSIFLTRRVPIGELMERPITMKEIKHTLKHG